MNQLEFNKPHIQKKLYNSGAVEEYQASIGRQAAEAIFGNTYEIDWYFKRLQEIIDQPGDKTKDQLDLKSIYFATNIPFMHCWNPGNGNKYLAIQKDLRDLVDKASQKLNRRYPIEGDEDIE